MYQGCMAWAGPGGAGGCCWQEAAAAAAAAAQRLPQEAAAAAQKLPQDGATPSSSQRHQQPMAWGRLPWWKDACQCVMQRVEAAAVGGDVWVNVSPAAATSRGVAGEWRPRHTWACMFGVCTGWTGSSGACCLHSCATPCVATCCRAAPPPSLRRPSGQPPGPPAADGAGAPVVCMQVRSVAAVEGRAWVGSGHLCAEHRSRCCAA
jgi:hypothetical protein